MSIEKNKERIIANRRIESERLRSRVFKKYLIYNICFVLIPIFSFLMIYFYETEQKVFQDLLASNQFALRQTMKAVDADVESLENFTYRLSTDKKVTPHSLRSRNYASIEAMEQLKAAIKEYKENLTSED